MAQARMEFVFMGFTGGEFPDRKTGEALPWGRVVMYDPIEVMPVIAKPFVSKDGGVDERRKAVAAMKAWAKDLKIGQPCSALYNIGTSVQRSNFEDQADTASLRYAWVSA